MSEKDPTKIANYFEESEKYSMEDLESIPEEKRKQAEAELDDAHSA